MKSTIVFLTIGLTLCSQAFRVTRDYGNGVKTYEDSKKKVYGLSVDGGNTWVKAGGSSATSTYKKELSPEMQEILDKATAIYNKMLESGQIYVVRGSVRDMYGNRVTLNAKDKVGSMGKDWYNADKFVYLKTLNGVKYKTVPKSTNKSKGGYFSEKEDSGSTIYRISGTSVSISEWHGSDIGSTRKWKTVYSGYLMDVYEYILLNKLIEE